MHLTTLRNCIIPAWPTERLSVGGAVVKRYSKESLIAGSVVDLTVSIQNRPIYRCSYTNIQYFFEKTNKNSKYFVEVPGFEPRLTEPEVKGSITLPLNHSLSQEPPCINL